MASFALGQRVNVPLLRIPGIIVGGGLDNLCIARWTVRWLDSNGAIVHAEYLDKELIEANVAPPNLALENAKLKVQAHEANADLMGRDRTIASLRKQLATARKSKRK